MAFFRHFCDRKSVIWEFFNLPMSNLIRTFYLIPSEQLLETHWRSFGNLKIASSGDMTSTWGLKWPFFLFILIENQLFASLPLSNLMITSYFFRSKKLLKTRWRQFSNLKKASFGELTSNWRQQIAIFDPI